MEIGLEAIGLQKNLDFNQKLDRNKNPESLTLYTKLVDDHNLKKVQKQ